MKEKLLNSNYLDISGITKKTLQNNVLIGLDALAF